MTSPESDPRRLNRADARRLAAHPLNRQVLRYLKGSHAHSDLADKLYEAAAPLGDVQDYCPDAQSFRSIALATENVVFAFASGMRRIAFRLDPSFYARAVELGGQALPEAGQHWVAFPVFRPNYPEPDLAFWCRKAYVLARGENPT